MIALSYLEKLLNQAIQHQQRLASAENEAVHFYLAKMACQVGAVKALAQAVPAATPPQSSTLSQLSALQIQVALNFLRSKISESPTDYGFTSLQEVYALGTDEKDHQKSQEPISLSQVVELGKAVAGSGQVPEILLDENHAMIRDTFRKFADSSVTPLAEKIHREDLLIPDTLIGQLRELGCFGLSIPETYGGFQSSNDPDALGMILVTEELSRGSLGVAGSLITRPEILARALLKGGTEEQKKHWLPLLASGEKMAAIAVTEPDFGSDVAGMRVTSTREATGWRISGTKTWCTFAGRADVLVVLARTNPDMNLRHKGLSLFLVEKPVASGHSFHFEQKEGGTLEGRAISTIGYRGMHSFEVKFDRWLVPDSALIGGDAGLGKGFYLQMEGFAAGRLQTAARANGLMHAALEKAISYSNERMVFGKPVAQQPASAQKLALMAAALLASRALTYEAARRLEAPEGTMLAAMAKLYASQTAEWLTRDAQQLHGGMGYAEEYAVSRYFVDARVLSIFEGAEEVLAVKVIAPALLAKK